MDLALTQMRHGARSLAGVSLAITLGVAFVCCTLLASALFERAAWNAVAAQYDGADVVVSGGEDPLTAATVDQVRGIAGVAAAEARELVSGELTAGSRHIYPFIANAPAAPEIRDALDLDEGRLPAGTGEIALLSGAAGQAAVTVGDHITMNRYDGTEPGSVDLVVVGLITGSNAVGGTFAPDAYAWPADVTAWSMNPGFAAILVTARPDRDASALVAELNTGFGEAAIARTHDGQARYLVSTVSGDSDILTVALLAFAVIALFVAGIVIANTFTILVAQRTRTLALLRCVGATRAQVRRSVLLEASVLGVLASALGVLLGVAVIWLGIRSIGALDGASVIPRELAVPARAIILPIVLGVVVTIAAAWGPASGATRIAPLAALRPPAPDVLRSSASRTRVAVSATLIVAGALGLAAGATLSLRQPSQLTILIGVTGGMLSFLGVVVGSVLIVPIVIRALFAAFAPLGGAPATIAAANSARNPRRTAATATALLIPVTLVTTMVVGAASTRSTLDRAIDARSPFDLVIRSDTTVRSDDPDAVVFPPLPDTVPLAVTGNPDIGLTTPVRLTTVRVDDQDLTLLGVEPATAREISRAPAQFDGLQPGTVIVSSDNATIYGIEDGDRLQVGSDAGQLELIARITDWYRPELVVTDADLRTIDPDATASMLWARLAPGADAGETVGGIQDSLATTEGISYAGGAQERQSNAEILDSVLLIVTVLLGVAVVIALVGVGNTLSLSVIERTRESAILRAMGLTSRQLRRMLAIEGVLIALAGAALGIVLGTIYGLIGALALLGNAWGVAFAVPPGQLILIVAIAVLAGVLASVLPARAATRASPLAALAE